ncbi:hypothetical protein IWW57_006189, partial [Coemansia sp. S610]
MAEIRYTPPVEDSSTLGALFNDDTALRMTEMVEQARALLVVNSVEAWQHSRPFESCREVADNLADEIAQGLMAEIASGRRLVYV